MSQAPNNNMPFKAQAAPQNTTPTLPFIGSKISLISRSGVRYEGTLYNIDTKNSSVALSEGTNYYCVTFILVRMFGTEGRREGPQIPALDKVFDYISFKGSDIRDLTVCEPTRPNAAPQQQQQPPQMPPQFDVCITCY